MIILGIDPGTACTGYGIVDYRWDEFKLKRYGCIRTKASLPTHQRLREIYARLVEIIEENQPDELVLEQLFFSENAQTAMAVGQVRGIALLAAANCNLRTFEYTPLQIKQAVAGYGRARKEQIQYMVKTILGLAETPKPDDAADALALAICHAHCKRMGEKIWTNVEGRRSNER